MSSSVATCHVSDDHGTEERCHKEVEGDPNKVCVSSHPEHLYNSLVAKRGSLKINAVFLLYIYSYKKAHLKRKLMNMP